MHTKMDNRQVNVTEKDTTNEDGRFFFFFVAMLQTMGKKIPMQPRVWGNN